MAKPRNAAEENSPGTLQGFEARLTNLLALLLVKDMSLGDQIDALNRAGFTINETAALLGAKSNTVSVSLRRRKAK